MAGVHVKRERDDEPGVPATKVPKAVDRVKKKLQGQPITGDTLKSNCTACELNALGIKKQQFIIMASSFLCLLFTHVSINYNSVFFI